MLKNSKLSTFHSAEKETLPEPSTRQTERAEEVPYGCPGPTTLKYPVKTPSQDLTTERMVTCCRQQDLKDLSL